MSAEIIVITYGQPKLEQRCLDSVKKHTNLKRHTLTVFDNWELDWNLGALWNQLITASTNRYICLLNSDTEVEEGWLDKLLETAEELQADAVGPVTNKCGVGFQMQPKSQFKTDKQVETLSGFCLLLRKAAWERVKGFCEDFPFYGGKRNF